MNRHASVRLRRLVDDAVGPRYDAVFARLDALTAGRCRCRRCHAQLLERCAAMAAELPDLPALSRAGEPPEPRRPS